MMNDLSNANIFLVTYQMYSLQGGEPITVVNDPGYR